MEKIRIGRDGSNEIVVPEGNDHVSNFHAEITKSDDGTYTFEDRSTNGTKINGVTVHQQVVAISPGDEIILAGQYHLLWNEIESPLSSRKTVINVQRNPSGQSDSGNVQNVNPSEGMLWNSRYRLIKRLGNGATAQVWEATDTKAGNIKVAVKIFSAFGNIGTRGIQIFEKEFTSVHGLIQTNLLIPNSYDTYGSIPYLVSNYCEKGSAQSLVGRMSEDDLVNFMKDTAQGLDYLHKHGIVHQDIKPDNILIDANDNFVLTDFGISNQSETKNINGTPAYMGPERYGSNPVSIPESDIWSFGATVFEMITGDVPFGDTGGVVQAAGEKIPEFPASFKSKTIKNLVLRCLDPVPENRPTAEEILLELEDSGGRKKMWLIAAAVAALVAIVSLVVWNHMRLKTVYYADYVEYWGIPHGVHELSSDEVAHRQSSYKFEIKKGKVVRLSLVNSKGIITKHIDTELYNRYENAEFEYIDNKQLSRVKVNDRFGNCLYVLVFTGDEYEKKVIWQHEDGTAVYSKRNTTSTDAYVISNRYIDDEISKINGWKLIFDKQTGLLLQRIYIDSDGYPACDGQMVYGKKYGYNLDRKSKNYGKMVLEQFIDANGNLMGDKIGLAQKSYGYDEETGRWISCCYMDINGNPTSYSSQTYCTEVKNGYDSNGNLCSWKHFADGLPVPVYGGAHEHKYTFDENGFYKSYEYLDENSNPVYENGHVMVKYENDANGFVIKNTYFDANNNLVDVSMDETTAAEKQLILNVMGLDSVIVYYDANLNVVTDMHGVAKTCVSYNAMGIVTEVKYYSEDGSPVLRDGYYASYKQECDRNGNITKISYFDDNGMPAASNDNVAVHEYMYDKGIFQGEKYYGIDGKPVLNFEGCAGYVYDFDVKGNRIGKRYLDTNGATKEKYNGVATEKYVNDPQNNLRIQTTYFNVKNGIVADYHYEYDSRGHTVKQYVVDANGKLLSFDDDLGPVVVMYEYNDKGYEIRNYYTDLAGKMVSNKENYCDRRYTYNERGKIAEVIHLNESGHPSTHHFYKMTNEFDIYDRRIHYICYNSDGKPVKGDSESKMVYDNRGNNTEQSYYDGYGKAINNPDGYHKIKYTYDNKNRNIEMAFYDVSNNLVFPKGWSFAGKKTFYNNKGWIVKYEYYGTPTKKVSGNDMIEIDYDDRGNEIERRTYQNGKLHEINKSKYNSKNQIVQLDWFNGSGQFIGKYVYLYEADEVTPKRLNAISSDGSLYAYQLWDSLNKEWSDPVYASNQNVSSNSWLSVFKNTRWPYKWNSDYTITKCTVSGNTVICWIQAVNVSKFQSDKESGVRSAVSNIKSALNSQGNGKPSNCILRINVIDKAGRDWFSM